MSQLEKANTYTTVDKQAVKVAIGDFAPPLHSASLSKRSQVQQAFVNDVQPKLLAMLQTSLDLEELLAIFNNGIHNLVNFDAIQYHNEREEISIEQAASDLEMRHRVSFTLITDGDHVGMLHFSRKNKFKQSEIKLLEEASKSFIYPARNALRYKEALQSALTDSLTQVGNRLAFNSALQKEMEIGHRYQTPLTILLIDIDHFKRVNDQFGHAAGDMVLQRVALCLAETCRQADATYRFGGEEFAIILNNTTLSGAMAITERLRDAIEQLECLFEEALIPVTISVGVANLQPKESRSELIARADAALYRAKALGRNRIAYSEM